MHRRPLQSLALALLALSPGPASGDTLELTNGDRLSGTVVRLADGELVFETDWAGELTVDWEHVDTVTTDAPMAVLTAEGMELVGTLAPGEDADVLQVTPAELAAPVEVPRRAVAAIQPPGRPPVRVQGHLAAGLVDSRGNTESRSLYAEGQVIARTDRSRFTLGGQGTRAETNGRTTADSQRVWLGYDHFVSERVFLGASSRLSRDEFTDVELRSSLGLSAGFHFFDSKRTTLAAQLGASYVDENFGEAPDESYPAGRWVLDFTHELAPGRVELFHNHEGLLSFETSEDLLIHSRSGLRFHLFEGFVATTQLNFDYDESPAPGRERNDLRYIVNLGFNW